jgi:hypothetical protein
MNLVAISWAVGATGGAVTMFSNSAYRAAADGTSTYQHIGDGGGLMAIVKQGSGGISQYAVTGNTALNMAMFIAVLSLALVARNRLGALTRLHWLAVGSAGVGLAGSAAVHASVDKQHYFGSLTQWSWVPALALLASVMLTAATLVDDRTRRRTTYALAAATVTLIAPMAALSPYGPRNFLPTYTLMAAIVLVFFAELISCVRAPLLGQVAGGLGATVVVVVLAGYFVAYDAVHRAEQERVELLRSAAEQGKLVQRVHDLPYTGYLHNPEPTSSDQQEAYNRYYGLPLEMVMQVVPQG